MTESRYEVAPSSQLIPAEEVKEHAPNSNVFAESADNLAAKEPRHITFGGESVGQSGDGKIQFTEEEQRMIDEQVQQALDKMQEEREIKMVTQKATMMELQRINEMLLERQY